MRMAPLRLPKPITVPAAIALLSLGSVSLATAHDIHDDVPRTAVVSAFAPELSLLKDEVADASTHSVNGVEFSVGTLQYLKLVFAREVEDGWSTPPFFDYPYANFGMMFPRSVTVQRADAVARLPGVTPPSRPGRSLDALRGAPPTPAARVHARWRRARLRRWSDCGHEHDSEAVHAEPAARSSRAGSLRASPCHGHRHGTQVLSFATTSPRQRRRTNSVAGRTSMPSSVRRARGSRQTTMRS